MSTPTKILNFKSTIITFLCHPSLGWCIPAKLLGQALGYANDGQKLNDLITHSWNKKNWGPEDSKVFTGKELEALKKETPQYGVSLEANSVLFLAMSGVLKVLLRSRSKTADEFRNFIASKGGELTQGLNIPKKALPKKNKKPVQLSLPMAPSALSPEVAASVALLKEMQNTGIFESEKLQSLYMDLWTRQSAALTVFDRVYKTIAPKDATQMVPVSNIQASSLTPNFDTIRSFFLTGHQKHPKFTDWVPAEEIGARVGLTADQARTFTSKYADGKGMTIANVIAMQKVKDAGGWFRGVAALVDDSGIPCFVNQELGCMGIWYLMEDGKMVWRNYWSPQAVEDIIKLIPEHKKTIKSNGPMDPNYLPPGVNFDPSLSAQATETVNKQ